MSGRWLFAWADSRIGDSGAVVGANRFCDPRAVGELINEVSAVRRQLAVNVSPTNEAMWESRFHVILGVLLLATLQFQTLPIPVGVQMMPLTSLLAVLFLVFVIHKIDRSLLLTTIFVFVLYAIIHSIVALAADLSRGESALRFYSWARQIAALIAGFSVFLVLRASLQHFSNKMIAWAVIIGSIPALLLALLNIAWGGLKQSWAGVVVDGVRSFIAPLGYTSSMRASGFSEVPAMFAVVIAFVLLPLLFYLHQRGTRRGLVLLLLLIVLIAFAWTFSIVGVLLILCLAFAGFLLGPKRTFFAKIGLFFLAAMVGVLVLFPSNQILRHARSLVLRQSNVSFTDRYYGTVGPFMMSYSTLTMFGYGLGGTVSHFEDVLPKEVQAAVASVKWKALPNLSTLVGRIFAETGAIGFALFCLILGVGFREYQQTLRRARDPDDQLFLLTSRLGLIATLASVAVAVGSFHMPYLWFWLAVIDARYIEVSRREAGNLS